jgi:hypothetical protein
MNNAETIAEETVTFFEVWMLRNLFDPTSENSLKVRNVAEDLINDDPEYWHRTDCPQLYEYACGIAKVQPWVRG